MKAKLSCSPSHIEKVSQHRPLRRPSLLLFAFAYREGFTAEALLKELKDLLFAFAYREGFTA